MKHFEKNILKKIVSSFLRFWIMLKEEKSIIACLFLALVLITLGIWTKLFLIQWSIVIIVIFSLINIEALNTFLEATVEAIVFRYNIKVKKIKDITSTPTFIMTIGTIIVVLLIHIPTIKEVI